jgi:hypothetical protein
MILRRVIEHVREQNWTAVGIDFVIVVIGVFVGIQVSNWNEVRNEQRETLGAMQRLEEDLRMSVTRTQSGIDFITENARYSDLAFDRLAACNLPEGDRDAFATGLYRLGKIVSATLVRTTFDELRDSGRLGLIDNLALRQALNAATRSQESHDVVLRMQAARIEPHIAYIENSVVYDIDGTIGGGAEIKWDQLDIDFDAACLDRRFRAAVGAVRNYTYDNLADVSNRQNRFQTLLAMIEDQNAR